MVKVIMGVKGTGKTKRLIEMVNGAVETEKGLVVCIETDNKLTYDISHKARLVNASEYPVKDFAALAGFICGMHAGNYDISHIFVDSLYKIVKETDISATESFLTWLDKFSTDYGVNFTVAMSAPIDKATDGIRRFF